MLYFQQERPQEVFPLLHPRGFPHYQPQSKSSHHQILLQLHQYRLGEGYITAIIAVFQCFPNSVAWAKLLVLAMNQLLVYAINFYRKRLTVLTVQIHAVQWVLHIKEMCH